jgi:hypothetical protein
MLISIYFNNVRLSDIPKEWADKLDHYLSFPKQNPWKEPFLFMSSKRVVQLCGVLTRYTILEHTLVKHALQMQHGSKLCEDYVIHDKGNIDDIVSAFLI